MTRTAFSTEFGKQAAILPHQNFKITQGSIPAKDNFIPSDDVYTWSHRGYHALDHRNVNEINFYAPFDMMCVQHKFYGTVWFTFFTSLEEVVCADNNSLNYVSMVCTHGADPEIDGEDENGNSVNKLGVGVIIRQGHKCYEWGKEGLEGKNNEHVHFEVMKGSLPKNLNYSTYMKTYQQPGFGAADGFINGCFAEEIFYKLPTDTVEFIGSGAEWAGHIQFKNFVSQPFDPTKYADGEHEYNGDHYYVINKQLAYGWQPKTVAGNLQKYYSEANGGRRIDNGWADYYYFTDSNGFIITDSWAEKPAGHWYYLGTNGKFLQNWQYVKQSNTSTSKAWYYFNPLGDPDNPDFPVVISGFQTGEMVRSRWIASGSKWCYVLAGGAMVANAQTKINGIWYKFDASGYCIDDKGSNDPYPNTPIV